MSIRSLLLEELTKTDLKEIESVVRDMLKDHTSDIEKKIREMIDDKETEKVVKDHIKDSLEQYHRILWQRRANWSGGIK